MRHTCLWTSETQENGKKRGGSFMTKKYRNFGSYLGVQEQKAEQRSNATRGRENESEKEQTHRSFSVPPIFPKIGVISVFFH